MSSAPSADEIARDARWLAQALDPATGVVRLVAMDRDSYRAASFLDDRLMQLPVDAQLVPWPDVEAALEGEHRSDARWIFHIGHVGSTLVSRLLGEIENVLAVREPRLLRDLALSPPEVRTGYLRPVPKIMSRTFAAEETACVKATSFASEIAADLVPPGERVLLMHARPRNYVASILAGENSVKEVRALADYRRERLETHGIALPPVSTDAERAAAAWACEMATLVRAADAMADRHIAWADFDALVADLVPELERIVAHFGLAADPHSVEAIARGPLMQRYSKALEYEYSPALRDELIAQAIRDHGSEVDAALAMLRSLADKSSLVERALRRAGD
ncbi:MAG: hypothetical protein ACJ8FT_07870 [Sphingomonas sp.]